MADTMHVMFTLHDAAAKGRKNTHDILPEIIYRWSPRSMSGEPVTEDELLPLFDAAHWAPSAFNSQVWHYHYALAGTSAFDELFEILFEGNQGWVKPAGALMILTSQKISDHNGKPLRTHSLDTGMSYMALAIEGTRRDLVVHPMSGFDFDKAAQYLKLDVDKHQVECMIAIGKPADVSAEPITDRKDVTAAATNLSS